MLLQLVFCGDEKINSRTASMHASKKRKETNITERRIRKTQYKSEGIGVSRHIKNKPRACSDNEKPYSLRPMGHPQTCKYYVQ
jgi:hypothetical protein